MAVFLFAGRVDKRILVFPVMRMCSIDGPTIVVSDDRNFCNLYHEQGKEGTISGVDILVTDNVSDFDYEERGKNYKHILYVSSHLQELKCKIDTKVSLKCFDRSFLKPDVTEKEESDEIEITFSSVPDRRIKNLFLLKLHYYKYLVETEERKELLVTRDKEIFKAVAYISKDIFNMNKLQLYKLYTRPKYEMSIRQRSEN